MPQYKERADELKQHGVDRIICLSVNGEHSHSPQHVAHSLVVGWPPSKLLVVTTTIASCFGCGACLLH